MGDKGKSDKRGSKRIKEVTAAGLYCKNGCNFFGNPAWEGCCSKCYKDLHQHEKSPALSSHDFSPTQSTTVIRGSETFVPEEESNFKFNKFEQKKRTKQEFKKKSVKKLYKKNLYKNYTTKGDLEEAEGNYEKDNTVFQPTTLQEKNNADFKSTTLHEFLKMLNRPAEKYIELKCRTFLTKFSQNTELTVEQQSVVVQDFYTKMATHIQSNDLFNEMDGMEGLMDEIERFVMENIYKTVFRRSSDDKRKDAILQEKIESFSWVTSDQLEINIDFDNKDTQYMMSEAKQELVNMTEMLAPQDKLSSIVNFCSIIFKMLKITNQGEIASADEFLPSLIYLVLQSNIPSLHSNIQYITRFCNPNKLMSGEGGYYFTNLCCSVTFILENLDAQSLNISVDEFNSYMKGETPIKNLKIIHRTYTVSCAGLENMQSNLNKLVQLHACQTKTLERCRTMRKEMMEFQDNFKKQMHAIYMKEHLEHGYVYIQQYLDKFEKQSRPGESDQSNDSIVSNEQSDDTVVLTDQSETADRLIEFNNDCPLFIDQES